MRLLLLLTLATTLACALCAQPERARAGPAEDAAALFRDRCATCHVMPDPALPMDLAWLDQVNRTT